MKQRIIKSDSELVESAGSQGGQDEAEEMSKMYKVSKHKLNTSFINRFLM